MRLTANPIAPLALATLALTGCDRETSPAVEPSPTETPSPEPTEPPISILRETPAADPADAVPTEPFETTVPFAEGGTTLSDEAHAAITDAIGSKQYELGGKVVLRGHTDSVGHDEANLRASQRRAEAVAEAFEEEGLSPDRIEVIALGEMRPVAPNAKLDGTPDDEGRAKNRRVDISVLPPPQPSPAPDADKANSVDAQTDSTPEAATQSE